MLAAAVVAGGVIARLAGGAVADGMSDELRAEVTGVNAHVTVLKMIPDFREADHVAALARTIDPSVRAAEVFTFVEGQIVHGHARASVVVKGVDADQLDRVSDVGARIVTGAADLRGDRAPILLGAGLARSLGAKLGDQVTVISALTGTGTAPVAHKFEVAGTFHYPLLAMEYDDRFAIAGTRETAAFSDAGGFDGVELVLSERDRATLVAGALRTQLGTGYVVQTWREINQRLFDADDRLRPLYAIAMASALAAALRG